MRGSLALSLSLLLAPLAAGCGEDGNDLAAEHSDRLYPNSSLTQRAYVKASNTDEGDGFDNIALSADGLTLAVGSCFEASAATGVDGDQTDNSASGAGAVYVFTRGRETWIQQAYLKASNASENDLFGCRVALSADGSTLAVGAYLEDSAATGINGDQTDNSMFDPGAVYVFTRSGGVWSQEAYVKASNTVADDRFGFDVALSADGSTLAVSAIGVWGPDAPGIPIPRDAGAAYVFTRSGTSWSEQAYLRASNVAAYDYFGWELALSADGSTLAVGAPFEDSAATGVDGDQTNNSAQASGAVYVFTRSGTSWSQQAYVKTSNTSESDVFGFSVALSADGSTLAAGATNESSAATGIGGDQADDSALYAGAVYVLARSGAAWSQQAYIKASNTDADDEFGRSVALSADGSTLAVGALREASAATGVGGDQADNSAPSAGAVYVFTRGGSSWSQRDYVKASNTDAEDLFGWQVALSGDGSILATSAPSESSAATGVDGDQADDSAFFAGAVYVFR